MKLIKGTEAKAFSSKENRFYLIILKPPYWWIRITPNNTWKFSRLKKYLDLGKITFRYGNG